MTFRIADSFSNSLARLTAQEQKAAKTAAFDLQMSPDNPGLSLHRVDRARDKGFWTARVNRDIRLVLHKTGGDMVPALFSVREVTRGDDPHRRIRFDGVPQGWVFRVASGKPQRPDTDGVVEAQLAASAEEQARLPLTLAGPNGAPPLTWVLDLPRPRGAWSVRTCRLPPLA